MHVHRDVDIEAEEVIQQFAEMQSECFISLNSLLAD